MPTQIINKIASHLACVLVLVLATLALSGVAGPAAGASPQRSPTLAGRSPLTSHGRDLGLQGDLYATIDPGLIWNTLLGGSGNDQGFSLALDTYGNIYVTGYSNETWQGTSPPIRSFSGNADAFVAKLDPSGKLLWNTFLGESGADLGNGIAVDGDGNVFVVGDSYEGGWQGTSAPIRAFTGVNDAFVAKLSTNGELIWNTFLGGEGLDYGTGIAVAADGDIYVSGYGNWPWQGTSAPVRSYDSGWEAFAAKLDSSGTLIWNAFVGGSGHDYGHALAIDGNENIYMTGYSTATWQGSHPPVRPYAAGYDGFATKLSANGDLIWNTFLGGSGEDSDYAIAVDGNGNVYVAGQSGATWQGSNPPVRAYSYGGDASVAKLNPDGSLSWNTFLGGNEFDSGRALAVDAHRNVFVVGARDIIWGSWSGDAYATKLSESGELMWTSLLGGDRHDYGFAIALGGNGNAYTTGASDATWGSPVRSYTGGDESFVAQISTFRFYVPLMKDMKCFVQCEISP